MGFVQSCREPSIAGGLDFHLQGWESDSGVGDERVAVFSWCWGRNQSQKEVADGEGMECAVQGPGLQKVEEGAQRLIKWLSPGGSGCWHPVGESRSLQLEQFLEGKGPGWSEGGAAEGEGPAPQVMVGSSTTA